MLVSEDKVRDELKKVIDPELFVNIVDLGLIYSIDITEATAGEDINTPPSHSGDKDGPSDSPDASSEKQAGSTQTPAPTSETPTPPIGSSAVDPSAVAPSADEDKYDGQMAHVAIEMTMTSPACPAGPQLIGGSKNVVSRMKEVQDVEVKLVMDPPWTPDRMTEDARDQLGIF